MLESYNEKFLKTKDAEDFFDVYNDYCSDAAKEILKNEDIKKHLTKIFDMPEEALEKLLLMDDDFEFDACGCGETCDCDDCDCEEDGCDCDDECDCGDDCDCDDSCDCGCQDKE